MEFKPILQRCEHPVRVYLDSKHPSFFPCRRCPSCRNNYRSMWRSRLYHHLTCGEYTAVFITLTYDNENLPLVTLDCSDSEVYQVNSFIGKKLPRGDSRDPRLLDVDLLSTIDSFDFNDYLSTRSSSLVDEDFPHFTLIHTRETFVRDSSPRFAVCCKKDIQDFIKRLRIVISRNPLYATEDRKMYYFICSEYCPTSYRPHYHGLLFFKSSRIARDASDHLVFDCWRKQSLPKDSFGNEIASLVANSAKSAAYVSKYVTCDDALPFLLRYPAFAPFHLQSSSVPIGSKCVPLDSIPDMLDKCDIKYHVSFTDPQTKEFVSYSRSFPSCFWRNVFPKFLCNGMLSNSILSRIVTRVSSFKSESDFPDYRSLIQDRFGLGDFFKSSVNYCSIYRHPRLSISFDDCLPFESAISLTRKIFPSALDYFHLPSKSSNLVSITPSICAHSIISCPSLSDFDLDLFLFGFEANRCACRKIFRVLNTTVFNDPYFYVSCYNRFLARVFSDTYSAMVDYLNYYPSSEAFVYYFVHDDISDRSHSDYFYRNYLKEIRHKHSRSYLWRSQFQL